MSTFTSHLVYGDVRFDQAPPDAMALIPGNGDTATEQALVVAALAPPASSPGPGSADPYLDHVLRLSPALAAAGNEGRAGAAIVAKLRMSGRVAYRLLRTDSGAGTEATFAVAGFARVAAPVLTACAPKA